MLTMWPPSWMCGRQRRVMRIRPRTFVSTIVMSSSSRLSQTGSRPSARPALLTRTSKPPSSACARSTNRSQLAGSVTSRSSAKSPSRSGRRSTRRAPTVTRAPASASACAVAAPIPLEAPVTTAVFPSSEAKSAQLNEGYDSGGYGRRRRVDHLAHLLGQLVEAERLLEQLGVRVEHSVVADGAVGVARHVEDPGLAMNRHETLGELA